MSTLEKDEAAILKALQRKPKGMRSTELWLAVHTTVRSLTTFQKRLKHLEDMGRIEIKTDINDPRARIITTTETSAEAGYILRAIDTLEKVYRTKLSRKAVRVTKERPGLPMENEVREIGSGAANLLLIAHETYLKSWTDKPFEDSHVWLRVEAEEDGVHIHWLTLSELDKWENQLVKSIELAELAKQKTSLLENMLASVDPDHGETAAK